MPTAMIFAAGLGTRLRPLTNNKPKALVEIAGKTMLQHTIDKLCAAGIRKIVINIHHFPELMRKAIENLEYPQTTFIISDESAQLLDTGGGLMKAAPYLISGNDPIILHNVDVLSDLDIKTMVNSHTKHNALATLAVSQRKTSRYFLWQDNLLCGWENISTGEKKIVKTSEQPPSQLAFSGIHIVSPEIVDLIDEKGSFSITPIYLKLATYNSIMAFEHDPQFWADLGSPEKLANALKMIALHPEKFV